VVEKTDFLEEFLVSEPVKKLFDFMKFDGSVPCSQKSAV
jgi:hypothetical protein